MGVSWAHWGGSAGRTAVGQLERFIYAYSVVTRGNPCLLSSRGGAIEYLLRRRDGPLHSLARHAMSGVTLTAVTLVT